jgi:hypothetical protein
MTRGSLNWWVRPLSALDQPDPESQRHDDPQQRKGDKHRRRKRLSTFVPVSHAEMVADVLVPVTQDVRRIRACEARRTRA